MMAWGRNCSDWDDSVDYAKLKKFDFKDVPEESFVHTTWHEDEPLEEVFWFSKNVAYHPAVEPLRTTILHLAHAEQHAEMMKKYEEAK